MFPVPRTMLLQTPRPEMEVEGDLLSVPVIGKPEDRAIEELERLKGKE